MSAGPSLSCPQVSDPEQELTVTHMYYTAWPDHGVPRNAMSVISFIHRVRSAYLLLRSTGLPGPASPGALQCGGGPHWDLHPPGLCDAADQERGTLSVFNFLTNLRGQHMKMVQTKVIKLHEHSLMYTIRPNISLHNNYMQY